MSEYSDAAPDEVTHTLLLADGRLIPSHGAIPTSYADGDQVIPVIAVTERR